MQRVVMAGATNFAQEVREACTAAGFEVVAMIEGIDRARVAADHDPPVVWVEDQASVEPNAALVIGIGQVKRRGFVERLVADGRRLQTVIHPTAIISPSATLGEGCVVLAGAIIGAGVSIGRGTVVNRGSSIGHHTVIGAWSFVGPGAAVAGEITAGEQVHIAVGATVRDRVAVGDRAVIGAGAAAVKDVPADTTVVGVPARPIEQRP